MFTQVTTFVLLAVFLFLNAGQSLVHAKEGAVLLEATTRIGLPTSTPSLDPTLEPGNSPIQAQNASRPQLRGDSYALKSRAFGQPQRGGSCPVIWKRIAADLKLDFLGCNDHARSAIRFAFHDAGGYSSLNTPYGPASGGADGSLLLSDAEISRDANAPMKTFRDNTLQPKYNYYKSFGVGAADFVQFAGAVGVKSCPGGPRYKVVVGRSDDSNACPEGTLPAAFGANSSYATIVQLFAEKGFNERDLAALLGAHSTSRSFAQQQNGIPPGGPQDSSPNVWDTTFYKQTQASQSPPGVYRFQSDVNLAQPGTTCGKAFTEFGNSPPFIWAGAFSDAMYRLSILGIPSDVVAGFTDCTSSVL